MDSYKSKKIQCLLFLQVQFCSIYVLIYGHAQLYLLINQFYTSPSPAALAKVAQM